VRMLADRGPHADRGASVSGRASISPQDALAYDRPVPSQRNHIGSRASHPVEAYASTAPATFDLKIAHAVRATKLRRD
jgi:hypothetical protein